MRRITATTIAGLLLLTGITPATATTAPTPKPKVQISTEGGFVAPSFLTTRLPGLTGYASGLVLTNDVVTTMERPDLLQLNQRAADINRLRKYAAAIHAAAVPPAGGWGFPGVADVPNTRIILRFTGMTTNISVYALEFTNGPGVSAAQRAARLKLSRAVAALDKYVQSLKAKVYQPTKYEAWIFADIIPPEKVGLANPASVFCESMGGILGIVTDPDGSQRGTCTLPDSSVIDEWEYFRSESKSMGTWPAGITAPTSACTVLSAASVKDQLKSPNLSGRWVLATGQAVPLVLRPSLPGEHPCQRLSVGLPK